MGMYDLLRKDGGPTLYGPTKYPVLADITEAGFLYATAILFFSLCLGLLGIRGSQRFCTFLQVFFAVAVLGSIMVINFGQEWEVAEVETRTQYRAGLKQEIKANIAAKIGLRGVNITLKTHPEVQVFEGGKVNETINYNERFSWNNMGFTVGRAGFGPFAGQFNQEFRAAQRKGVPYPILWVAEYFTIDGEGIRWGRHYLQAGFWAHIFVWLALPLWVLSLVMYKMVLRYGAYFTLLTGLALLMANILWVSIRNANELRIPFEDGWLIFHWGWTFWLSLATGGFCVIISLLFLFLEIRYPKKLTEFFGVDITNYLEEYYVDPREVEVEVDDDMSEGIYMQDIVTGAKEQAQVEQNGNHVSDTKDWEDTDTLERKGTKLVKMYRMQTILGPRNRQGTTIRNKSQRKPLPLPKPRNLRDTGHENSVYENVEPPKIRFSDQTSPPSSPVDGVGKADLHPSVVMRHSNNHNEGQDSPDVRNSRL